MEELEKSAKTVQPEGEYDEEYEKYLIKMRARVAEAHGLKEAIRERGNNASHVDQYSRFMGAVTFNFMGAEECDILSKTKFINVQKEILKQEQDHIKVLAEREKMKEAGTNKEMDALIAREKGYLDSNKKMLSLKSEKQELVEQASNAKTQKDKKALLAKIKPMSNVLKSCDPKEFDAKIKSVADEIASTQEDLKSQIVKREAKIALLEMHNGKSKLMLKNIMDSIHEEGRRISKPSSHTEESVKEYNSKIDAINQQLHALADLRQVAY